MRYWVLFLALLLASCQSAPRAGRGPSGEETPSAWKFVVISDVHVYPSGKVAPAFTTLVQRLVELNPRFVVVTGDSTNGNLRDGHGPETIAMWWKKFRGAIAPLTEAGIPVLPLAGNHDFYTEVQRKGFVDAFADLAALASPLKVNPGGAEPRFYSVDVDGVHLTLAHVIDQAIDADLAGWIVEDLKAPARLRFVFGHVPLKSVMAVPNTPFMDQFGTTLVLGGATAYIAGHEHLAWDELLELPAGRTLRQITVGTASATYTFPIRRTLANKYCLRGNCSFPFSGARFAIDQKTRLQKTAQEFLLVTVRPDGYTAEPMSLDAKGGVVSFH